MDTIWLEAECSRYEFFVDVVGQTNPDIGIVAIDNDVEKGLALVEDLRQNSPDCNILVLSTSSDGQLILQAMRAGAKEFLTQPIRVEDLIGALERVSNQHGNAVDGKSRGSSVIAVGGATGGVGSTSVAVNIACRLAADDRNTVVLVDLDLSLGDADVFLDTIPDYTLADVAQNISRLDFSLLKRSLTKHSSGLYLLPRPVQLQDTALIKPQDLHRVIGLLKATFTHLVIDMSKSFSSLEMEAMEAANHILLVSQLDLPCLRNVVRLLMSLDEVDGMKDKVRVIVNRAGLDNGQISLKKAQETIGKDIFWKIPNDYQTMVEVRNNGIPLIEQAPKASITQAVNGLADKLSGNHDDEDIRDGGTPAQAKSSGGLSRLFGSIWGGKGNS
jgi:pilus assembly protein CpaE